MGNNRYSAEDRKANQDAHEARMARFTKSEAGTKARQAAEPRKPEPATSSSEPVSKKLDTVDSPEGEGA
jgi:hypothetical protein